MSRIIDCTLFFNEFRLLTARLGILRDAVDLFVIAEGDRTFSGEPKPLRLQKWVEETVPDLADRIIVIEVTDFPANPNPWIAEVYQRNAVLRGLRGVSDDDILMFFDVDEIPNIDSVLSQLPSGDIAKVSQEFYYYYLNLHRGKWSLGTATYARNMSISPQEARTLYYLPVIEDGGWHFSYLMSPEKMAEKIGAFSHQEFNKPDFKDPNTISDRIAAREDLFGRKSKTPMVTQPFDNRFPEFLVKNKEAYSDLILDVTETGP